MAILGEIIDGKYEVLREIGRGGMSVVYLAMDKRLNKQWAIKEFRKDKDDESRETALKALLNEAELMKKLDHPRLPRIVDIIETNQTVYIIEDYIEGENLKTVLKDYGKQPQEAVIEWAKQLCEILDYLHSLNPPIIYRDMKPANIILKPDNSIAVLDFGIAREYKEGKTGDTTNIGTRGYAAPEQFGDMGQTDARTDIYSMGVTLYHLITGNDPSEPPYELLPIRAVDPTLSSGLEWVIQKCTQLNPEDRFQSCSEVTYVLENLEKFEDTYKRKRRNKLLLFFISFAMALAFSLGGLLSIYLSNKEATENYEAYLAQGNVAGCVQALELDDERPDAYTEIIEALKLEAKIIVETKEEEDLEKGIYAYSTITSNYLTQTRLEKLKASSLENYILVNYEMGRLLWNRYETDDSTLARNSRIYFIHALEAIKESGSATGGLTEGQYALARSYGMIAHMYEKRTTWREDGDSGASTADTTETEIFGLDATLDRPFAILFSGMQDILANFEAQGNEVPERMRIRTISCLANLFETEYSEFDNAGISDEEIKAMYESIFKMVVEAQTSSDAEVQEIMDTLIPGLKRLGGQLESHFKFDLEVDYNNLGGDGT